MSQQDWEQQLSAGITQLDLILPAGALEKLSVFIGLLVKWNTAYNLTAVREPAEMVSKHLLDSLSVLPFLKGDWVVDVGTGAGLPGIPLALACPEKHFVLLDSNGKKIRFVIHAAAALGLKNMEVVQARAEDYRPAEPFATVISRAFAATDDFLALTSHLGASGGRWLAMKGVLPDAELRGLPFGIPDGSGSFTQSTGLECETLRCGD